MHEKREKRWERVPSYVEWLERYPDTPRRIRDIVSGLRERTLARWRASEGEFYCDFCGSWRSASEVVQTGSTLTLFACRERAQCEAYKVDPEYPEHFAKRGWFYTTRREL